MKPSYVTTIVTLGLILGSCLPVLGEDSTPGFHDQSTATDGHVDEIQIPKPMTKEVDPCLSPQQVALLSRLAGIPPLCEELQNTGSPVGREVNSDFIWVIPQPSTDYYYILAAHVPRDGGPLVTAWTGAGLSGAVLQFCGDPSVSSVPGETETEPREAP